MGNWHQANPRSQNPTVLIPICGLRVGRGWFGTNPYENLYLAQPISDDMWASLLGNGHSLAHRGLKKQAMPLMKTESPYLSYREWAVRWYQLAVLLPRTAAGGV